MNILTRIRSNPILTVGVVGTALIASVGLWMGWGQIRREGKNDRDDQDRRAHLVAHQQIPRVIEVLRGSETEIRATLPKELEGHRRLLGFAVFGPDGKLLGRAKELGEFQDELASAAEKTLMQASEISESIQTPDMTIHILAMRINDSDGTLLGSIIAAHDISHLDERATTRLRNFVIWIVVLSALIGTFMLGIFRYFFDRPLQDLANWMRAVRGGDSTTPPPRSLPSAFLTRESEHLAASFRAARAALQHTSLVSNDDQVWTRERLRSHAVACLRDRKLVVVSNREPYMHQLRDGQIQLIVPAGGLVTALDPVLQSCGGIWIAHGAGKADRRTADRHGRLAVPPDKPSYTLRRVWLSLAEEQGYYYGFSNEGLWPLCHLAYERPTFRKEDWEHYVQVNRRFADTILEEIGNDPGMILVQDYHLALVPQMLKEANRDLTVGIFWHIPWPNPEAFRICPWGAEILKGILGADLVGFHLQQYCNNFLDTVDRSVEAKLDWDHFAVELGGHLSVTRPFPISVESWQERGVATGDELSQAIDRYQKLYHLEGMEIILGVDRIDYTKGLPERFRAVERFFEKNPEYRSKVTFVQLGAPSRTHLRKYRDLMQELQNLVDEINWKFQTETWRPIQFLADHHPASTVYPFMRMASVCVVSSLHDGMNLVAKEFASAQQGSEGVLILSSFAGAARELSDALIINPYDIEQFADTIRQALTMDRGERAERAARMRQQVEQQNVYWWAAQLFSGIPASRQSTP